MGTQIACFRGEYGKSPGIFMAIKEDTINTESQGKHLIVFRAATKSSCALCQKSKRKNLIVLSKCNSAILF